MIFNSFPFIFFFIPFYILYWLFFNHSAKIQNFFLLLAGYIFYAWTDWRFLIYLVGASLLNFYIGMYIGKTKNNSLKKLFVNIALLQGVGGLLYFKYFNFFITSFKTSFYLMGINLDIHTFSIIIPLGISFFTFKIIGYILDINKGKIKAITDWVAFFSYVSFFPTILSGPIDSSKKFIPQLEKRRVFDRNKASDALRQIIWGMFKKVVIADNCSIYSNSIFNNFHSLSPISLLMGAIFYAIQLYADFSGYSDMAIGIARLLGFEVSKNFDFPFFAQNIAEFWRKWHISLTSWLTEYVFTPLSIRFRDYGNVGLIMAIVLNFTICGIWHGANWTYILYGFVHGCYFIPLILKGTMNKKKKIEKGKMFPTFKELRNIISTFSLVMLTLIIFRADNFRQGLQYYKQLFTYSALSVSPKFPSTGIVLYLLLFIVIEWIQRDKDFVLQINDLESPLLRWTIYYFILCSIFFMGAFDNNQFIYFQF